MPKNGPSARADRSKIEVASTVAIVIALIVSVGGATVPVAADHNDSQEAENLTMVPVDDGEEAQGSPPNSQQTCIPQDEAPTKDEGNEGGPNCDPYNGHMPGDTHASYQIYAGPGPMDEGENITTLAATVHGEENTEDFDFSKCGPPNAHVAGFDRHNDDPGLQTDEPFLKHVKNTEENDSLIYTDMFDDDDIGGETTYLAPDDQIVAEVQDCYKNPDEPGWYQMYGWSNGTTDDGKEVKVSVVSHYFYICNCTSRQQAVNELGPPPSAEGGGGGGGNGTGNGTATPTPTASPTPGGNVTGTGTGTATPTATQTTTGEDTTTETTTTAGGGGGGGAGTPTASPTDEGMPGFGAIVAIAAVLAAAAAVARRGS